MNFQGIPVEEALDLKALSARGFQYGLLYSYDGVQLDKIENIQLNRDKLVEVRFFNNLEEIHVFKRDGFEGVLFTEEEEDEVVEETHLLIGSGQDNRFGKALLIKNYVDYDEDGQAFIAYTRPYAVKE